MTNPYFFPLIEVVLIGPNNNVKKFQRSRGRDNIFKFKEGFNNFAF